MLIKFIIACVIFFLGYRIVKPFIKSVSGSSETIGGGVEKIEDIMVQDPYCRAYFSKKNGGAELKMDEEILFFCSPECRDNYIKSQKKQARYDANN